MDQKIKNEPNPKSITKGAQLYVDVKYLYVGGDVIHDPDRKNQADVVIDGIISCDGCFTNCPDMENVPEGCMAVKGTLWSQDLIMPRRE